MRKFFTHKYLFYQWSIFPKLKLSGYFLFFKQFPVVWLCVNEACNAITVTTVFVEFVWYKIVLFY